MIRKILETDKENFLDMAKEFYQSEAVLHPVSDECIKRTFDELMKRDTYLEGFILEKDNAVAGYALVSKSFSPEVGGMCAFLEEIYLKQEFRGFKIGSQFLEFLEENFDSKRYRLEVESDNIKAKKLYTKMGYKVLNYIQMVKDFD